MKSTRILLSSILSILLAVAAIAAPPQTLEDVVFDLEGMTCGSCAESITAALRKVDGVAEAAADLASATARVRYDPAKTSLDRMTAAVDEIGYRARPRPADDGGGSVLTATPSTGDSCETDVSVSNGDAPAILQPVMAELSAVEADEPVLAGSRCQAYEACSLYSDLSGADGDVLAMYEREKSEDGKTFDDFRLPEFTARTLDGAEVRSADLAGRPVLLAFVAVHCRHSMDSLPILDTLYETYAADGLRVVAVAINSGTVDDVNTWFPTFDPKYEVWVASGDELGDAIGSHLVPTYLLVDAGRRVTEKLVGFKEGVEVTARVLARLAADAPGTRGVAAR